MHSCTTTGLVFLKTTNSEATQGKMTQSTPPDRPPPIQWHGPKVRVSRSCSGGLAHFLNGSFLTSSGTPVENEKAWMSGHWTAASGGEEGIYRDAGVFPSGVATAVPWRTRRPFKVGLGIEPLTKLVNVCRVGRLRQY